MVRRAPVLLILGLAALDSVAPTAAAQQTTVFQLQNKANNGCIRVEPPPPKAIIAGFLRTFSCGKSPSGLVEITNDRPAFLRFNLGQGETRCINVRPLDTQKIPSDIFANSCTSPTSKWELGQEDAQGFGELRLFPTEQEPRGLCLSVVTMRRTVVIDTCADKPEQRWKLVPISINQ